MFFLAVLAQTATAVPMSPSAVQALADLKAQLVMMAASVMIALAAYLKTWLRARLAEKLSSVVVAGVEGSTQKIRAVLVQHLGPDGMKALADAGIDLDKLPEKLTDAAKRSVESMSIAAGTEDKLGPLVKKVTSQRLAVDGEGNPVNSPK